MKKNNLYFINNLPISTVRVHMFLPNGFSNLTRWANHDRRKGYFLNWRFCIFNKHYYWMINPNIYQNAQRFKCY